MDSLSARKRRWRPSIVALCLASFGSCSEPEKKMAPPEDADPLVRAIDPPPGKTRSMPPHDIHAEGVGPYRLGATLHEVLGFLPGGPRIELWPIESVASFRLVRAVGGALILGSGKNGKVEFISVLDPSIAKTSKGIGVGATIDELKKELGEVDWENVTRDPRLVVFTSLPGTHFVVDRGRVVATLTKPSSVREKKEPRVCSELQDSSDTIAAILEFIGEPSALSTSHGCLGPEQPVWAITLKNRVMLVGFDSGKFKRLHQTQMSGIVHAGLVDVDADGRDEVAFIKVRSSPMRKSVDVTLSRLDSRTLGPLASARVVSIDQDEASLVGAALSDIDLYAEVSAKNNEAVVDVIYVHRKNGKLREVIPLVSKEMSIRRKVSPPNSK